MHQLQFYAVTFFFFFSSIVFASSTPTCSRRNRCSTGRGVCQSMNITATAIGAVASASTFIRSTIIQSQAATQILATSSTTPARAITTLISSHSVAQPTPSPPSLTAGDTSESDIQAYLTAHNSVRAQHGAVPLIWSDSLASKAQQWANGCVFQHSGGTLGPFGENIAAGTGSSYNIATAVKSWTDEVSAYDSNNPIPSHFTQIVWKATTQVGCAVQTCDEIFAASFGSAKYYVCEYFVPGNVIGSFRQNVQV